MIGYQRQGTLEVICGGMFSGKSEELIRRIKRARIAKQSTMIFKPALDNRYGDNLVCSHDGAKLKAISLENINDVFQNSLDDVDVIGFDESQFFQDDIVLVVTELANRGIRVIVAGLDMDFRALPFGPMPDLMALAESVTKLQAVCNQCGAPAWCSQRLIDDKPAKLDSPTILIGAKETYEPRCRIHHEIPSLVTRGK